MAADCAAVRRHLVEALEVELIGPFAGPGQHATAEETLELPPSRWYATGFLAPQQQGEEEDPTLDDALDAGGDDAGEDEVTNGRPEPPPGRRPRPPSSMGLSVLLPPSPHDTIRVAVEYADYELVELPAPEGQRAPVRRWRRLPRAPVELTLPLDPARMSEGQEVTGSRGLWVFGRLKTHPSGGLLPPGTRGLSLFLVNRREPGARGREAERYAFQARLTVSYAAGLFPRPNVRDAGKLPWDEQLADLQYRKRCEWAVGHNVSAEIVPGDAVTTARTCWVPRATVPRIETSSIQDVMVAMEDLEKLAGGAAVHAALDRIVSEYLEWIRRQRAEDAGTNERRATQKAVLDRAEEAARRIREGIDLLASDAEALEAFRVANQAMAVAARRRKPQDYTGEKRPEWRLFQLAFVLLNVPSIARDEHPDRERVELIFFPTGGGKTEAYLGVIAFLLALRRLRGARSAAGGLGVAVLLRYTLRLLTLDQLSRAATLICALEVIRQRAPRKLGEVRFAIGLWVGRSGSPNTLKEAAKKITEYKNGTGGSPFPLTDCPWCGRAIGPESLLTLGARTNPTDIVVGCLNPDCDFVRARNQDGLPVLFVDEQIYRELPCFLLATVDKFALLPWRGEAGMLFGRVRARQGRSFYGPVDGDDIPIATVPVKDGLRPPDLIVQDELHLISGPLGTMVGLYEGAVDLLASRTRPDGSRLRPKIIASTATVRRAQEQIRAIYDRRDVGVFPPPGIDEAETFFARVDHSAEGRLYVGVASPGRPIKSLLLRVYVALLGAAQRHFDPDGPPDQPADPYMTLAGYFNSLRELGGMRRLVEDEVRRRVAFAQERRPLGTTGSHPWLKDRLIPPEPLELTSRESTEKIKRAKAALAVHASQPGKVDVLLASNMISVGVDIDRLGLMVVAGQPKTTSEYIQASSRVGRDRRRPGLVVTAFNFFRPRDRSHYERFTAYHESFYRFVEATSVTPFSGPALDRGLAGVVVASTRHAVPELTAPSALMSLAAHRQAAEQVIQALARRAGAFSGSLEKAELEELERSLVARSRSLLDAWDQIVTRGREEQAVSRRYSPWDKDSSGRQLLWQATDDRSTLSEDEEKFVAPSSMRDVEPSVQLWLDQKPQRAGRPHVP